LIPRNFTGWNCAKRDCTFVENAHRQTFQTGSENRSLRKDLTPQDLRATTERPRFFVYLALLIVRHPAREERQVGFDRNFIAVGPSNAADPFSRIGFSTGESIKLMPAFLLGVEAYGTQAGVAGTGPSIGVLGIGDRTGVSAHSSGGTAVQATTNTGTAIHASSGGINIPSNGTAIVAQTNGANSIGVFVSTDGPSSVGLIVDTISVHQDLPIGQAAQFLGHVEIVQGNLTVIGGTKSAAVPHPDGSYRLLYCMESPESWFEDFGTGELRDGKAEVQLDPDFAAVVHSDAYHVFLTPEGDSRGLYVTNKRPTGFEVREQQGGASSLTFSYRVVAKRKDIAGPRLETVTHPGRRERPAMPEWSKAPDV
jgi:hypothetical protein